MSEPTPARTDWLSWFGMLVVAVPAVGLLIALFGSVT